MHSGFVQHGEMRCKQAKDQRDQEHTALSGVAGKIVLPVHEKSSPYQSTVSVK
jgi:hypothetical protein